jgi:hypothetical protein
MAAAAANSGLAALPNIKKEPGQQGLDQHACLRAVKHSDQAVADLVALAVPAGAIAAVAAAAQHRASAAPKHVWPVLGKAQAVGDEVVSGEAEDCEPVSKRRKNVSRQCVTSGFVGVGWDKRMKTRKWIARINHDGKMQHLGHFDGAREAARAVDTEARRLRGDDAHGGRPNERSRRWRLNFPTEREVQRAQERGLLLTAEDKAAASRRQGPSKFVGVCWSQRDRKWMATIRHDGKRQHLGYFDDEHEAARAIDTAARRLRGEDAHGGRAGTHRHRLNFPTDGEVKRAQETGALLTQEEKTAATASERQAKKKGLVVVHNLMLQSDPGDDPDEAEKRTNKRPTWQSHLNRTPPGRPGTLPLLTCRVSSLLTTHMAPRCAQNKSSKERLMNSGPSEFVGVSWE